MAIQLSQVSGSIYIKLSEDYYDGVTCEPLIHAVFLKCGHSFNEDTAIGLRDRHMACPFDRIPFKKFYTNINLRNIVAASLQAHQPHPIDKSPVALKEEPSPAAIAHFERGKQLFFESKYEQAINAFLAALILYPTYEKAQVFFESTLEAQKKNPSPYGVIPLPHSAEIPQRNLEKILEKKESISTIPSSALHREGLSLASSLPSYISQALNPSGRGKALIRAVDEGDKDAIRYLLAQDTLVNIKDGKNRTPLSAACEKQNTEILQLLIQNGAAVDGEDAKGALLSATKNGHRNIIKILIEEGVPMMEKKGPNAHKRISDELTPCLPLEIVAKNGDALTLQIFIATIGKPNGMDLNAPFCRLQDGFQSVGVAALEEALFNGHMDIVQMLIEKDVDIKEDVENQRSGRFGGFYREKTRGESILLEACAKANLELLRLLLEKKNIDLDRQVCGQFDHWYTLRYYALQSSGSNETIAQFIRTYSCNGKPPARIDLRPH